MWLWGDGEGRRIGRLNWDIGKEAEEEKGRLEN